MAVFPLIPTIQHYAWGGSEFLPNILDLEEYDPSLPFAELWMGAHPKSPSSLQLDENSVILLQDWVTQHPTAALGESTIEQFGAKLPFLFKILDVKKMLSIQVHPSKSAAKIGFAREHKLGIPLDAPHRNFKDDNHKPEVMLALTDFWLLHGFKAEDDIEKTLINIPEFQALSDWFAENKNIGLLYRFIMEMTQEEVNNLLSPLKKRLSQRSIVDKNLADYWAQLAFDDYTRDGNFDRGIFSIYLFNLLKLKKGEVIFQGNGIPHAYLEGANVELMANSDNVFRGGLTPKHIDIKELLTHTICEPVIPTIIKGTPVKKNWMVFKTPVSDFELSKITVTPNQSMEIPNGLGPGVYWVYDGEVRIASQVYHRGEGFWVDSESAIKIEGKGILYRAGMPHL